MRLDQFNMRADEPALKICQPVFLRFRNGQQLYRCENCQGIFVVPDGTRPEDSCPLQMIERWNSQLAEQLRAQAILPLGDWLAATLAAIGITKERWGRLHGKPCRCWRRQAKLNQLGFRLAKMLKLVK